MEKESSKRNYNDNLTEVVYIPNDNEKAKPQLLKLEDEEKPKDSCFLYVSAFTADIVAFATGTGLAWSSPAFAKLKETDPSINPLGQPLTSMQESWIASLICLGAAIGPIFMGKSADLFGRKKTLIILSLPILLAYVTLSFASSITLFYVARLIKGLGVGGTFAILPMYLGEISEDHNRGKFSCIMAVFVTLGLLYPFLVGPLISLKLFSFSCAVPLMLFLIFFTLFIPESPVFLLSKGHKEEAKEVLKQLRNKSSSQLDKELLEMARDVAEHAAAEGGATDLFKLPNLRRGLVVSVGLVILQQFAGINAIQGFMGQIFDASGSGLSTYVSTILVAVIQIMATFITSATVEKLGRKFLLLLSTVGSCVSIIILGLYFYLKKSQVYNVDNLFWLPVVCLMVYIVTFNMGLGPLPWTVMGEIFPPNVKSLAATLSTFICFFTSFGVTLGFPIIVENVGMAQCFWLFGLCCALGIVFIHFFVPETKGKSLSEIQELLSRNSKK